MPSFQGRISQLSFSPICKSLSQSDPFASPALKSSSISILLQDLRRRFNSSDSRGNDWDGGRMNPNGFQESPPEPIPNRALRGNKPLNNNRSEGSNFSQINRSRGIGESKQHFDRTGHDFLEKFKLGIDKKGERKPHENATAGSPEGERLDFQEATAPPQEAEEIFKKMKETGLIPNAVAMLDGLCKDGLVQEALKLFGVMREKRTIPEVVIYTAVVEGYTKAHKPEEAIRIFRKMQNNGISPNAFSYTVIIQGLCKCHKLEDAVGFSVEMLEAGHSPNVTTFVGLVYGVCNEKGVEEARNVIRTLREKGFFINEKAVREFLDKKAPFSPLVWEAIFGKKLPQRPF